MTSQPSHTTILSDLPAGADALDFQPYIDTLADIIASPNTNTPLTIGVFGTWGSGKPSLMRLVQGELLKKDPPGSFCTTWFDAWKYEKETELWRALLLSVLMTLQEAIEADKKATEKEKKDSLQALTDLQNLLYSPVEREEVGNLQVNWGKFAEGAAQGAIQIGLSFVPGVSALAEIVKELQGEGATGSTSKLVEALKRERTKIHIEQVQFLDQFQEKFRNLVQQHIVDKKLRLVVFIDDLDRCLPEKAVEVLEAIKLFLDVEGCVFVLGLDHQVIARGIEIKYKELGFDPKTEADRQRFAIDGTRYLEKIIQLPFQIPPIERIEMQDFVTGLVKVWPHEECARVFAEGLGGNPRQVKRTVNVFLLLTGLADRRKQEAHPVRLAKIVAIQNAHPRLYDFLKDDRHHILRQLEMYFLGQIAPFGSSVGIATDLTVSLMEGRESSNEVEQGSERKVAEPPVPVEYLRERGIAAVRRVLAMHPDQPDFNFSPLTPDAIRTYFTLTRQAEAPVVHPVAPPRLDFEPQMIRIPAGLFAMGTNDEQAERLRAMGMEEERIQWQQPQHNVELSEYLIGKYPVTNLQYQFFVQEAGHKPPHHWDGDQYPEGLGEHPVTWISWNDANSYCLWLTRKTGKPYRLPTEAEWEKAARGGQLIPTNIPDFLEKWSTENLQPLRIYPWGDEWEVNKCNSKENGVEGTTPVGQYSPAGDSPYGCVDMTGNVWEWCMDNWDEKAYEKRKDQLMNDPIGPEYGEKHVLRGGSYDYEPFRIWCTAREPLSPQEGNYNDGFRIAASSKLLSPN